MRATAELFLQLKRDPFEALAKFLQSVDLGGQQPDIEARIASEIEVYLAAIGSGSAAAPGSDP